MQHNKIEFKIGDTVTFKPYESAHSAKVMGAVTGGLPFQNAHDKRVFYKLSGLNVLSTTTGESIIESIYYNK